MPLKSQPNSVADRNPTRSELRKARERFLRPRNAEIAYQRQLTAVAKQVGAIVKGFAPDGVVTDLPALRASLLRYAEVLRPWARTVTATMHGKVAKRDATAWNRLAREMGRTLRREIESAPIGKALREAMAIQVKLITSLPTEAAERVHKLTTEAIINATRSDEIAKEIMRSGAVTASRAQLIARTEVARTSSLLVESRARHIGSSHYIWRTVLDGRVRKEHRRLEGKVIAWDDPPVAGPDGMKYHAGQGPRCRCFAEPIIPESVR